MKKILKKMFISLLLLIVVLVIIAALYVNLHPTFGGKATGASLEKIQHSANWNGEKFKNTIPTIVGARQGGGDGMFAVLKDMLFPSDDKTPTDKLPSQTFDKQHFNNGDMAWFGHSTVLFKTDDQVILADPVFHNASPLPGTIKPFAMQETTEIADLPDRIDVIIISHDHYDHLDWQAIKVLNAKTDRFLVGLGVKAHLLRWGVPAEKIQEFDWYEETTINAVRFVFTPTRHFSGRGLTDGNKTLWGSWVVQGTDLKLFFSGDSGYFDGFKTIGEQYGPFDIAFIEDGAYDNNWPEIHMLPEQSVQAAIDLQAEWMVPIHWGKFSLARHTWKDPIERVLAASERQHIDLATPLIGKTFALDTLPTLKWWESIK